MEVDRETELRTHLRWVRIMVGKEGEAMLSEIIILAGSKSYLCQIWWELPPLMFDIFLKNSCCSLTFGKK